MAAIKRSATGNEKVHVHRHTLGVDGSEVSVLEEGDEVGLSSLLKGHDRRGLEPEVGLVTRCQNRCRLEAKQQDDSP